MNNQTPYNQTIRELPSLTMSLLPVAFMLTSLIGIMLTVGSDAISDFSPTILLVSAMLAVLLSVISNTYNQSRLLQGLRRSSSQILPAVPLLILIAMISTTWLLSGVVPTLIDYGIRLLNPTYFLVITCVVCAAVSVLTGSSWSTIATIGVAFIGIGKIMGYNEGWIAGAIISGAYFGDKVSPLSDTTVIASSSCGVDLFDHIRFLMLTAVPAMAIALITFAVVGLQTIAPEVDPSSSEILSALNSTFNITPMTLVIPLIVGIMIAMRIRTVYTLGVGTVLGIAGIFMFQPGILEKIEGTGLHSLTDHLLATLKILWSETAISTGNATLDSFVSTGGITGMLPTVMLVICAMLFGAAMIGTGMLSVIAKTFTRHLSKRSSIVGATVSSGLFLNACTDRKSVV